MSPLPPVQFCLEFSSSTHEFSPSKSAATTYYPFPVESIKLKIKITPKANMMGAWKDTSNNKVLRICVSSYPSERAWSPKYYSSYSFRNWFPMVCPLSVFPKPCSENPLMCITGCHWLCRVHGFTGSQGSEQGSTPTWMNVWTDGWDGWIVKPHAEL